MTAVASPSTSAECASCLSPLSLIGDANFFVLVRADSSNVIAESNESDNVGASATQVLVRQPQRDVRIAELSVFRGGRSLGRLTPSMNFYPAAPNDPIGTPSIDYGALKDLYSSVIGFDGDLATFRLFLNPGVMWLWVGGAIMALGGLLAAWPGRRRIVHPEQARRPALVEVA